MRVALFPTCVVDAVSADVGVAAVRILRRLGHEVVVPERATCCGQPAWNAGQADASAQVARTTLAALHESGAEAIVVPAGSCATMIRVFWQELFELAGDEQARQWAADVRERTYELSEFLDRHGLPEVTASDGERTVYHRSCHMLRELRIEAEPEQVLRATGAEVAEHASEGRCCGFGGLFSVKLPELSTAMADDVLDGMLATGATRVVGCDSSCLLQLEGRARRRGDDISFWHLATVVDAATSEGR